MTISLLTHLNCRWYKFEVSATDCAQARETIPQSFEGYYTRLQRIFAIDILDAVHYRDGERWLIEIVELDLHANVCSAAVELLCEVGTEAAIDPLLRLKARFPHHIFIQFAADLALKRILES